MNDHSSERRNSGRFPIEQSIRVKSLAHKNVEEPGIGKTLNMSSSGVLFTTEQNLTPGRRVEIAVTWPAQLDNKCALKFVARGKVVRTEPGMAAIEIEQYEFRTAGTKSAKSTER